MPFAPPKIVPYMLIRTRLAILCRFPHIVHIIISPDVFEEAMSEKGLSVIWRNHTIVSRD